MHKEIPIKVTAMVDEGIAPLVEVMNAFEGVVTYSSCQGDDESAERALIWFEYRGKVDALTFYAQFARQLFCALAPHAPYELHCRWESHSPEPTMVWKLPAYAIEMAVNAVSHWTPKE